MIIWHGQWANRTPDGIYRIRFDNALKGGLFTVEIRRQHTDEWKAEKSVVVPDIAEWYGIRELYNELELLP